jgi:hypothetical protein
MVGAGEVAMTRSVERWAAQTQGRMESQSTQPERAHPLCTLRHIHQQSFQLHLQFVRAHGLPKGEVTLFASGGGGWSRGVDRLL